MNKSAILQAKAAVAEAKDKVNELSSGVRSNVLEDLADAKDEFARRKQELTALHDRVNRTAVRSPVKGIINRIEHATIGGVVKPGDKLMEVVPLEDNLLIEAKVKPADVGFLIPGQGAMVKITAYDFTRYGGLEGTLEHISADTVEEQVNGRTEHYYLVRVRTTKTHLGNDKEPMTIIPGMQASISIVTGEKSILEYIAKPFQAIKDKALRER